MLLNVIKISINFQKKKKNNIYILKNKISIRQKTDETNFPREVRIIVVDKNLKFLFISVGAKSWRIDIGIIVSSQWAIHLVRSYQFAKLQIDTSNSMLGNIPDHDSRRIRNDP